MKKRIVSALLASTITLTTIVGAAPCLAAPINSNTEYSYTDENQQFASEEKKEDEQSQEEKKEDEQSKEEKKEDEQSQEEKKEDEQSQEEKKEDEQSQEKKEELPESPHVIADESMNMNNSASDSFQWTVSESENDAFWEGFMKKSEDEKNAYADEIIERQNRAEAVPFTSITNPNANGLNTSDIQAGVNAAFNSIVSGNPGAFMGWTAGSVFKQIFGNEKADTVSASFNEVNSKLDSISNQLEQLEQKLEAIQKGVSDIKKELNVQNIRSDISQVYEKKIAADTFLQNMKVLDKMYSAPEQREQFYIQALRYLDANKNTVNDIMQYGTSLSTIRANTGKSVFYAISALVSQSNLGWDSLLREAQIYQNSILTTTYLESVTYLLAIKGYELSHCKEGEQKYIDLTTDIALIQAQVETVSKEMNANLMPDRQAGNIIFHIGNGNYIELSNKLRFQTDENNQMDYNQKLIPEFERTIYTPIDCLISPSFVSYLCAVEMNDTSNPKDRDHVLDLSMQNIIVNNLKTLDKNGMTGTEFLRYLGFSIKYDSPVLTFLTSSNWTVNKASGSPKSIDVKTVTIDEKNNVSDGNTRFTYTDEKGNLLDKMNCSSKGFISFISSRGKYGNPMFSKYFRTGTLS